MVDPTVLKSLHDNLLQNALKQVEAQKSGDYLTIPGGIEESLSVDGTSTAKLDLSVLLIKKADLAIQIQTNKNLDLNLSPENKKDILVDTVELKLNLPSNLKVSTITNNDQIKASLAGTTTISSDFSNEVLKKELAGLSYDNAQKLLKNKIGVEAVNLEIWPWWVKSVTSNQNKINIRIENN